MANFFIGVDGEARETEFMYVGVDGVARRVKSAYIGVDGEARLFYGGFYLPSVNETIVSIGSGEYFNAATKYAPGTYEIQIAGAPSTESSFAKTNCFTIQTTINKVFKIVALCNAYTINTFLSDIGIVSSEGTIFGGAGGRSSGYSNIGGAPRNPWKQGALAWNAACCHFLPANGVFGIDYLRCFHCGAPASGVYGGGGAYGGGAGGRGSYTYVAPSGGTGPGRYYTGTGAKGADGAGGTGGTGGTGTISGSTGTGMSGKPGNSGSGIGAGTATLGGVAWYNGTTWAEPTRSTNTSGAAYVRVIFKHA